MRFVIALILLCVNFCFSCRQQTETVSLELAQIDSIMWDHPDSALALLEKVPKPSPSDKLNDATWCLLYTQAWDKNYKKHTSDSLINVALRYFDKQGDGHRKAQAWFYKGSVLKDLGKLEEATECYVWARDLIGSFDEPLFASLICQTLGRVYREQKVYDLAFEQFREAIYYVTQVPRRDDWSHAYSELGRTFAERKRLDSARYYFERSLENAELINDLKAQAMAIGELGVVYFNEGDYKRALEYQKEELALKSQSGDSINFSSATFGIAVILYRMGELDSAEVYFKESLNTSNIERIQTTNLALYFISRRKHNHEEAFKYIDQYRFFTDSINSVNRTQAIAEAQEKYDNEKLENEKKTLLLEKERLRKLILRGWIVMIFFIGLLAFGYQRKLWLKERRLRKSEEHIHEYLSKVHENEEIIQTNKILMKSILEDFDDKIRLKADKRLSSIEKIETYPYPLFPTDLQAQMMVLQAVSKGTSIITETVFESRFGQVMELAKMGADIVVKDRTAVIKGVEKLYGADVYATDLRAGACLVMAGMKAEGYTTVNNIKYIDRGYKSIEEKYNLLGADIKRI